MDFLKNAVSQASGNQQQAEGQQSTTTGEQSTQSAGGFLDGLKNKVNSAAGGGVESEKNEDALDKYAQPLAMFVHRLRLEIGVSTLSKKNSSARELRTMSLQLNR
jgi:hypothetical protein